MMGLRLSNDTIVREISTHEVRDLNTLLREYKEAVGQNSPIIEDILERIVLEHEYTDAVYAAALKSLQSSSATQETVNISPDQIEAARRERSQAVNDIAEQYFKAKPFAGSYEVELPLVRDLIRNDGRYPVEEIGSLVVSELRGRLSGIEQDIQIEKETDPLERAIEAYFQALPEDIKNAQIFDHSTFGNIAIAFNLDDTQRREFRDQISIILEAEVTFETSADLDEEI